MTFRPARRRSIAGLVGLMTACCVMAPGAGSASAAAPQLSIKSAKKIVDYTRAAPISGRLSTGEQGAEVVLQEDRFPFDRFKRAGTTATGPNGKYSFRPKPTVGTRYRVVRAGTPSVRSRTITVYLNLLEKTVSCNFCDQLPAGPGDFTFRWTVRNSYPPSLDLASEPVYFYWGQRNGSNKLPSEVRLVKTLHPTGLGPGQYELKMTYPFHAPNSTYRIGLVYCSRDHFAKDGFGLPGHHRCGDATIPHPAYLRDYLG
jgi:hypothetical protein